MSSGTLRDTRTIKLIPTHSHMYFASLWRQLIVLYDDGEWFFSVMDENVRNFIWTKIKHKSWLRSYSGKCNQLSFFRTYLTYIYCTGLRNILSCIRVTIYLRGYEVWRVSYCISLRREKLNCKIRFFEYGMLKKLIC